MKSAQHFYVNIWYTIGSLVQTGILLISYRSKKLSILALPVLIMLTIRSSFRLLDLEQTKPPMLCHDIQEENDEPLAKDGMSMDEWG